jgi:hypothetical protein
MRSRARGSRVHGSTAGVAALAALAAVTSAACADPDRERLAATTRASYDKTTGRLTELTFDANKNGKVDTWTEMDGSRPVRARIDADEDGRVDRWEYYDGAGKLARVGFSRAKADKPDAWAYPTPDGTRVERIDVSSTADDTRIDRREHYDTTGAIADVSGAGVGQLTRLEEDTNRDGRPDKWERYEGGLVKTAEFDENGDGDPDRRLTYAGAELVSIETAPDGRGGYGRKVVTSK